MNFNRHSKFLTNVVVMLILMVLLAIGSLRKVFANLDDSQFKRNPGLSGNAATGVRFNATAAGSGRTNRTGNVRHNIPTEDDVLSWSVEAPRFACDENNSASYMVYCQ
ncbi:unnamed protein product, partial [Anisakis simplex]